MIKTIVANTPEKLDEAVNEFEKTCIYPTGVSRVFATQTHVNVIENGAMYIVQYTAIIFYKGVQ